MQSEMPEVRTRGVRVYSAESDLIWAKELAERLTRRGVSDVLAEVAEPSDVWFLTGPLSSIIVILLSPEYLASGPMPPRRNLEPNEDVVVRGIVARRFDSENLPEHWSLTLLGDGTPLEEMDEPEVHFALVRAAADIFELASVGKPDAQTDEQTFGASPVFSASTLRVLEKSREISSRKRIRAITSACLVFGFGESRNGTPTAAFLHELISSKGNYAKTFSMYLEDQNEVIEGRGFEYKPFAGFFARPLGPIMRSADLIARKTTGDGSIHARHLLAAMLNERDSDYSWSIEQTLRSVGFTIEEVKSQFRTFLVKAAAADDQKAWNGFLIPAEVIANAEVSPGIPLGDALMELNEPGRRFVREVASVAVRLGRPADTFSALAMLVGWVSEKPQFFAQGILDELRRQRPDSDPARMFQAPPRYWELEPNAPVTDEIAPDLWSAVNLTNEYLGQSSLEDDVRFRVLVAAITVGDDGTGNANAAKTRLAELGFDLNAIRVAYRRFLAKTRPEDPQELYDELLGPVSQEPLSATPQIAIEPNPDAYQKGYSAFASDHVSYDRRDRSQPLDDALGVGVYADNIAQLIAAQKTKMPLSIGLFGDWGSGKSYFMALLQERLSGIAESNTSAFHKRIVQIRFNAWHYLDTNLWASLVCEIFDQLFGALEENNDTTDAQIRQLKEELARESALAAEAKEALTIAENARLKAENELRAAIREREHAETKVATLLNDLTVLIGEDEGVKKELDAAAAGLGLPALKDSYEELNQRVAEVRTIGGRARALGLAVFAGSGWWTRSLLLVVAISLPLLIGWIGTLDIPWIRDLLSGAGKAITQIAAAILAVSGWIAQQARRGNSLLNKLEDAHKKVSEIRERRQSEDDASKAEKVLAQKRQEEEQARHTLNEAEERMKKLRAELSELAPGRQLIRFLKERASADDYRRHLGLVSLVRRDFEKLSKLMLDADEARVANLPKIDRIVLYIDDLDRCRADRVVEVLEAVHLLLAFPLFAVVVAVDPRWLRQSLLDHYPSLLGGREMRSLSGNPSRPPATPQDYLEKIFQVPFNLKDLDKEGYGALVKGLFEIAESSPTPNKDTSPVTLSIEKSVKSDQKNLMAVKQNEEVGKDVASVDPSTRQVPVETVPTPLTEPEVAKVIPAAPPAPPDPARLLLSGSEIADASLFQPLFRTPRAVKRFANTYCLIRVGVNESDWPTFVGSTKAYRAPMFMLAVTSAYPALSRPWLTWLRTAEVPEWTKITPEQVGELSLRFADSTEKLEWENLAAGLDSLKLANWNTGAFDGVHEWIGRVSRFTF